MVVASKNVVPRFIQEDIVLSTYMKEIQNNRILKTSEEKALIARIRQGDRKAMNLLLQANLKFVVSVCFHYKNRGLPLGDLISEGNLGLIRAAQRFDPTVEYKFISYAVWWIRQAILSALANQTGTITLSTFQADSIKRIRKVGYKLVHRLGRQPRAEDLELETGLPAETIALYAPLSGVPLSHDATASREAPGDLEMITGDDGTGTEDAIRQFLMRKDLDGVMDDLDGRTKEVVKMFFGIGYGVPYSLGEIGERFRLSRERVRQIKQKALNKLRHASRLNRLHRFDSHAYSP